MGKKNEKIMICSERFDIIMTGVIICKEGLSIHVCLTSS